jgi:hypothetical protein
MSGQSDIDEFNKHKHLSKIFRRHCDEFWIKNAVSEKFAISSILAYAAMSIAKVSKSEEHFKNNLDKFYKLAMLSIEELTKSGNWEKIKNKREEDVD